MLGWLKKLGEADPTRSMLTLSSWNLKYNIGAQVWMARGYSLAKMKDKPTCDTWSVIKFPMSVIEEKILIVEQRKDDARKLNRRYTMEMNVHMAYMFHVATQQTSLPADQRTASLEFICQDLGVEFGKFETKPYIEAMTSEIEISYPTEITAIMKARRAATRAQSISSSGQAELKSITLEPTLKPSTISSAKVVLNPSAASASETAPSSLALGK